MSTRPYIAPEDLTPLEAQTILAFFNQATTAREIGDRIEIAGEYDVGTRVGQRILDRRTALGGAFTGVQQIADVPYVGPERFTEIVVVLTGRVPGASSIPPDVQAELDALRAALASVQPTCRISLTTARSEVFIGQSVVVFATVTDLVTRKPKPAVMLTVATTWGTLQSPSGMLVQEGQVVVVRTDTNGRVKLALHSPVDEDLTAGQRTELESALLLLDPGAPSPEAARASLESLASAYRIERNVQLRNAIDIHFRKQREAVVNGINRNDLMHTWRFRQALVTAYVHADGETGTQAATAQLTALLPLKVKDWLGPFFLVYRDALERESSLDTRLENLRATNADKTVLLDQLLGGIHSYVARERGGLGEIVGQSATDRSVTRFVSRNIATLPVETQMSILPGLSIAAQNVRARGLGSLGAVTQSRADVRTEVETITAPLGDLATLATQMDSVQVQINEFQGSYVQFQSQVQSFNSDFASFSTNITQFNNDYGVFQENLPIIIGIGGGLGGIGVDPGFGGIGAQPGVGVEPGIGVQPGVGVQPGIGPGIGVQPGVGVQPGIGIGPGIGVQPGVGVQPGIGAAPGVGGAGIGGVGVRIQEGVAPGVAPEQPKDEDAARTPEGGAKPRSPRGGGKQG